jgi:hypothetical protein
MKRKKPRGILGDFGAPPAGWAPKLGELVWLPAITPPVDAPLKDPFEHLFALNLSVAELEEFERLGKENREKVVRMLGLAPDVSEEELKAALQQEQRRREQVGAKSLASSKRGVEARKKPQRDQQMAREFLARRAKSILKDTPLMEKIGKDYRLGRSAAIEAIKRGLKEIVR